MDLLVQNGTIVTSEACFQADIAVSAGRIEAIGKVIKPDFNARIVDARGLFVLPGAIDSRAHLCARANGASSADDYFTGTRAAACGGTTTVFDCAVQEQGELLPATLARREAMAAPDCCVDYAFAIDILNAQGTNVLNSMAQAVAQGVTFFGVSMPDDASLDDALLLAVFEEAKRTGALVGVHAENRAILESLARRYVRAGNTQPWWHYKSRDEAVEGEAVERAIRIARMAQSPLYITRLSGRLGLEAVERAQRAHLRVVAETCPQYLHFTNAVYRDANARDFVLSPPIKDKASQEVLWQAIERGAIEVVASDHCPFMRAEKDWGNERPDGTPGDFTAIPGGCNGIETLYLYMLSSALRGRVSIEQVVKVCAENPAKLLGIDHLKGALRVGMDADIVLFDARPRVVIANGTLHGAADHTIWEGASLRGRIIATYSRGRLIYKNGQFLGKRGNGRRIKCKSSRVHGTTPSMPLRGGQLS